MKTIILREIFIVPVVLPISLYNPKRYCTYHHEYNQTSD